ncbi:MAG: ABC transporter substrate-binding protein [Spirochaetaceae bacterium]|nr:ABC transporter substrate-binding protein [Spirochaetaceae bacterium]
MRCCSWKNPVAVVLVLGLAAGAAWATGEAEQAALPEREMIENVWGEMQEKPEYGGTITFLGVPETEEHGFDNYYGWAAMTNSPGAERLGANDWAADRSIEDYSAWWSPGTAVPGLAESWEQPDANTTIFHLRQGVHWHDLPPVNGREFVADDVVFHFQRIYGVGGVFEKSPFNGHTFFETMESVEATDKYTVEFKHPANAFVLYLFLVAGWADTIGPPREVIEEFGEDSKVLTNFRGTGPFIIDDYNPGTSLTWVRNPNYWGHDELFPDQQFQLPYVDEYKQIFVADKATKLAALRSAQLDVLGPLNFTDVGVTWEERDSLEKTHPDLQYKQFAMTGQSIVMRHGAEPFYPDIRVREALQMAINRDELAATWGGGVLNSLMEDNFVCWSCVTGYYTPFDELPERVQQAFQYNPERARELLAEAGYPDGFKTTLVISSEDDLDLFRIAQSYFAEIGVEMEIKTMEPTAYNEHVMGGQLEQMAPKGFGAAYPGVDGSMNHFFGRGGDPFPWNIGRHDDATYDATYTAGLASGAIDDYVANLTATNDRVMTEHWLIPLAMNGNYRVWWPWLKSYRGEFRLGTDYGFGHVFARVWVDQALKESMGY